MKFTQEKPRIALNVPHNLWNRMVSPKVADALGRLVDYGGSHPRPSSEAPVLLEGAENARIMVTSWRSIPLTNGFLDQFPSLELIIHAAGSIKDTIPNPPIDRELRICTGVHVNAQPVAEFTLGVILCALRDTFGWRERLNREGPHLWWGYRESYNGGYHGKSICVVGFGAVAKSLLPLLRAFRFDVMVVSDNLDEIEAAALGVEKVSLEHAAIHADVITLHEADIPQFQDLISREILFSMKPGAWLINTSRGGLVDEDALIDALSQKRIWALLDVAKQEPPPPDHPFYSLSNCILTPHVAGSIGDELQRFGTYILREVRNHLECKSYENELHLSTFHLRA